MATSNIINDITANLRSKLINDEKAKLEIAESLRKVAIIKIMKGLQDINTKLKCGSQIAMQDSKREISTTYKIKICSITLDEFKDFKGSTGEARNFLGRKIRYFSSYEDETIYEWFRKQTGTELWMNYDAGSIEFAVEIELKKDS